MLVAVRYQKAVYGHIETSKPLNLRLPEERWVQMDKGFTLMELVERSKFSSHEKHVAKAVGADLRIDDPYFHCLCGFWNV